MLRRLAIGILVLAALALISARVPGDARRTSALGSFGRGGTIVLVHGLGSSGESWLPVARDLARDHRVVLVELPGHGIAEMPGRLSLEDAALALDRAIAAECDGPVVLVGHSVGGLVAAEEALRSPGRVRALVLVETALRSPFSGAERVALLAALERDYRGTLRENYVGFGRDSAQGLALYEEAARVDSSVMKAWIRLALTADLSREAGALRVPVLAVFAARTWPEGESWSACADTLGYSAIRGVTPARVSGAGHFVMLDRPARLAQLVRHFELGAAPEALAALVP